MKELRIVLSNKAVKQMTQLKVLTGSESFTELIRKAMCTLKHLEEEKIKGAKIVLEYPDNHKMEIVNLN